MIVRQGTVQCPCLVYTLSVYIVSNMYSPFKKHYPAKKEAQFVSLIICGLLGPVYFFRSSIPRFRPAIPSCGGRCCLPVRAVRSDCPLLRPFRLKARRSCRQLSLYASGARLPARSFLSAADVECRAPFRDIHIPRDPLDYLL